MTYTTYLGGKMVYDHGLGVKATDGVRAGEVPQIRAANIAEVAKTSAGHAAHALEHTVEHVKEGELVPAFYVASAAEEQSRSIRALMKRADEILEIRDAHPVVAGYVVELACVRRRYGRGDMLERARRHTRDCILMGNCVESGYALIGDGGGISVLDTHATPHIVHVVRAASRDHGIRVRVIRKKKHDELRTTSVEQIP